MSEIFRSTWNDFPDVVVQTTVTKLTTHPKYREAKQGNLAAAVEMLSPFIKLENRRGLGGGTLSSAFVLF
jgi:hypothetical protein